jgi:hypothetical protein
MSGRAAEQHSVLRGVLLATLTALLTVVGHLAGGGTVAPDLAVLVVLLPLLAGVLTALADRSRSVVGATGVLGTGQLVMHQLLAVLTPSHSGHTAHHAMASTTVSAPTSTGMFVMHAVATLAIVAALRFADRGIAAFGAALRRVLPRRLRPLAVDRPLTVLATPGPSVSLRLARALAVAHVRRGPPVGC